MMMMMCCTSVGIPRGSDGDASSQGVRVESTQATQCNNPLVNTSSRPIRHIHHQTRAKHKVISVISVVLTSIYPAYPTADISIQTTP